MFAVWEALLLTLCANIDVLFAAASRYKLLQSGNRFLNLCCISLLSTLTTLSAVLLGRFSATLVSPHTAQATAGVFFVLSALHAICQKKSDSAAPGHIWGLSLLLSVNNLGLGIAAGAAGLSPIWITGFTLPVTLGACELGILCAKKLRRYLSERSLTILSNSILLLIGLYELLS